MKEIEKNTKIMVVCQNKARMNEKIYHLELTHQMWYIPFVLNPTFHRPLLHCSHLCNQNKQVGALPDLNWQGI
jgi:hypothetical protein